MFIPKCSSPDPWPDDEVRPVANWCQFVGISLATGRRLIAAGQEPIITQLSMRRIGIRGRHHRLWLDQRTINGRSA